MTCEGWGAAGQVKCQGERTSGLRESPDKGPEAGTEQRPGGLEHRARGTQWLGSVGGLGHWSRILLEAGRDLGCLTEGVVGRASVAAIADGGGDVEGGRGQR